MPKYLKNKKLVLITIIYLTVAIMITMVIALKKHTFKGFDPNTIDEKNVLFWKVFGSNLVLVLKIYIFGIITVGIYALFGYLQNILSIGLVAGGLLNAGYDKLAMKMIPHGILEYISISLAVATVTWIWGMIVVYAPGVIKRKISISDVVKKVFYTLIVSVILNAMILIIAGIVEVVISRYKVL